jgi:hypothetical protein
MKRRLTLLFICVASVAALAALMHWWVLPATNEWISRCSDQSAPQYIEDRDRRRRECGSE